MAALLSDRRRRGVVHVAWVVVVVLSVLPVVASVSPASAAGCPVHRNGTYIGTWSTYDGLSGGSVEFDNVVFTGSDLSAVVSFTIGSAVFVNSTPLVTATVSCASLIAGATAVNSVPDNFDGTISPDGYQFAGNWVYDFGVLSGTFTLGLATETVAASAVTTLTTDSGGTGATPSDPLQTTVASTTAGDLSISQGTASGGNQNGYQLLDRVVKIDAPPATTSSPLSFSFELDASSLNGATATDLAVFRNGVQLVDCTGPADTASPDPCISSRVDLPNGNVQIAVLTSAASIWSFGVQPAAITGPAFFAGSAAAPEGAKVLRMPVTLSRAQTTAVSVHYAVRGLSATAGVDFKTRQGTVAFKPSIKTGLTPTVKTVNIPLIQDSVTDPDELVTLTLSSPSPGTVLGDSQGVGDIIDSTSPTALFVYAGDATAAEGDTGSPGLVQIPIALSSPAPGPVSVQYALTSSNADSSDYSVQRPTGVIKFAAGTQVKYVTVSVTPDTVLESDETIQVTLSNASGATTARNGTLTITNDD